MPGDMDNVGVSRVEDEDTTVHDVAQEVSRSATSTAIKRAKKGRAAKKSGGAAGGSKPVASKDTSKKSENASKSESSDKESESESDDKPTRGLATGDDAGGDELQRARKTARNVKSAGSATNTAVKTGFIAKMLNGFHMAVSMIANASTALAASNPIMGFLSAAWALVQHGAAAVGGFVSGVAGGIAGFATAAVGAVAGALGIGTTAATVAVAASAFVSTITSIALAASVVMGIQSTGIRDTSMASDCATAVTKAEKGADIDQDAQLLANAKAVYSILKTYGLSDNQIAGVLGNYSTESSIDPTIIEGIYGEHYDINGPKHQGALKDLDAYVRGPLSEKYRGATCSGGPVANPRGYTADDGKMYPGIGMGQYTAGNAKNLIETAKGANTDWYTIDFQMAYTLAKGSPIGRKNFWADYKEQSGGPAEMANYFSQFWEGNTANAMENRRSSAESWAKQIGSWSADTTYANSVIEMAKNLGATATDNNVAKKKSSCVKTINADNSSIATAAVSYAYETQDEGRGNDGTALYQRVHKAIFPGDPWFQSCDRGVATAVRWSGSDDDYPAGATGGQLAYLLSSDKWTKVGTSGSVKMEELKPGDVFCLNGHTFLYVGNDAVKKKYPNSNGDSVSASFCERSPGVGVDASDIIVANKGQDWIGRGEYQIFRCTKPDKSAKYVNAGSAS